MRVVFILVLPNSPPLRWCLICNIPNLDSRITSRNDVSKSKSPIKDDDKANKTSKPFQEQKRGIRKPDRVNFQPVYFLVKNE